MRPVVRRQTSGPPSESSCTIFEDTSDSNTWNGTGTAGGGGGGDGTSSVLSSWCRLPNNHSLTSSTNSSNETGSWNNNLPVVSSPPQDQSGAESPTSNEEDGRVEETAAANPATATPSTTAAEVLPTTTASTPTTTEDAVRRIQESIRNAPDVSFLLQEIRALERLTMTPSAEVGKSPSIPSTIVVEQGMDDCESLTTAQSMPKDSMLKTLRDIKERQKQLRLEQAQRKKLYYAQSRGGGSKSSGGSSTNDITKGSSPRNASKAVQIEYEKGWMLPTSDSPQHEQSHSNNNRARGMKLDFRIAGKVIEGWYSGPLAAATENDGLLLPNGVGIVKFANNNIYMGELQNGKLHGRGTLVYDDDVLKGEFMDNCYVL